MPKKFRQVCQICTLPLQWNVLSKEILRSEDFNFLKFPDPLLESFGLYSKKFLAESSKLQSTCLEEQFAEIFFRNISSFWITFDIWQIFCGYFAGTFRQFCPNCILPVKRKLLEDFFWNCFCQNVFRFWAKNFQTFGKRNCGGVFETVFYLSGRKFWKKSSSEKFCFHSLNISIAWAKLFLEFWLKTVGRLVETAFHVSRGTFREKFFQVRRLESLNIFRNWTEEFSTLTRNFRQFRQNCNLPVQKNILIKSIFFERITFSKLLSDY